MTWLRLLLVLLLLFLSQSVGVISTIEDGDDVVVDDSSSVASSESVVKTSKEEYCSVSSNSNSNSNSNCNDGITNNISTDDIDDNTDDSNDDDNDDNDDNDTNDNDVDSNDNGDDDDDDVSAIADEQEQQKEQEQNIKLINNNVFENSNIVLPTEFIPVIEEIDSKEKLFELIPLLSLDYTSKKNASNNLAATATTGGAFNNILLAIYEDECVNDLISNPFFSAGYYNTGPGVFHTVRMKKHILPQIVGDWDLSTTSCMHVLFIKKGLYYQDHHKFKRLSSHTPQAMATFLEAQMDLEINVTNTLPFDVFLNWWEDEAEPIEVGYIISKQTSTQRSFLGHIFYAEDAINRRLVNWFIVVGEGAVSVTASKYCKEEKIDDADVCDKKFRESFKSFVYDYWTRKREALNYVQRNVVKPVTKQGFRLLEASDSLYESLLNFVQWSNEENWWLIENQTAPILNYEESSSYLSHLGDEQWEDLNEWITPQMQQWSGIDNIELQSIFGIRKYTKNAQIQMHVDPITSHLLSAIIFVSSSPSCEEESSICEKSTTSNNGEEWPLQILDNHDILHEIVMKHGQVLFYESARNPCARIKPFSGESYIVLYVHFKSPNDDNLHNYDWMFQEEVSCSSSSVSTVN